MPRLQIQIEKEGVHQVQASEDLTVAELLDHLRANGLIANDVNWAILHKGTNKDLSLDRTLDQLGLPDGDELYVYQENHPLTDESYEATPGEDLKLEVSGPDGESHSATVAPDTLTQELLDDLVRIFKLPPDDWVLRDQQFDTNLDPNKTLVANGVVMGRHLHLRRRGSPEPEPEPVVPVVGPDLKLEVIGPDGKSHHTEEPPDIRSEILLKDLIEFFKLPPDGWVLVNQQTGKTLDGKKTLAQNGVASGERLLLTHPPKPFGLKKTALAVGLLAVAALAVWKGPAFRNWLESKWNAKQQAVVVVSVDPKGPVRLKPSQTQRFTARVQNSNKGVSWHLDREVGSISNDGTYVAPFAIAKQETVLITARSDDDPSRTATAEVVLVSDIPALTIDPAQVPLAAGQSQQFTASENGVNWSLQPEVGTITPAGLYVAPQTIQADQTVTITARSAADPARAATATVSLAGGALSLTPHSIALDAGGRVQFSLVGSEQDSPTQWSLSPASGSGSISGNGLYIAPTPVLQDRSVIVSATPQGNIGSARASITLRAVEVSISSTPNIPTQGAYTLVANVKHSPNHGVTWSINPPIGSISTQGVYRPPQSVPGPTSVIVTATSMADSTKVAQFTINLVSRLDIKLNSYNRVMHNSEQQWISATVVGAKDTSVTFNIVGPGRVAEVEATRILYVAPETIAPSHQTVVIRAVSNADPSRYAMGNLQLVPH